MHHPEAPGGSSMRFVKQAMIVAGSASVLFGLALPATARDAFEINLDVNGQMGSQGFSSVQSAINTLSNTAALQSLVPSYTDTSPAVANVNLRGVTAVVSFATGSTTLQVVIPAAGINQSFTGATREDSAEAFLRFLEGRGASTNLFQALANTPTDPLVGNPNSLMNQMVASDFGRAVADATGPSPPGFGLDARYGSFAASGFNSQGFSLPLNYSWRLSERDALDLDVPLSYSNNGGGNSYSGNVGLLWRHRVLPNWTLQPSVRFGGVGSLDLGSAAGVWSVALNSTVNFDLPADWQLTLADGITYISTIPINIGRLSINYDISNVVFRNGLVASHDLGFRLMDLPLRGSIFFVDTRFTGSSVFMMSYQEMGFFASAGSVTPVRIGAEFLMGDHNTRGFAVNTGVRF
jgi:hypothetical protein